MRTKRSEKPLWRLWALAWAGLACLAPGPATAYIDPGTSQAVFSGLGWLLSGAAAVIGFLIWPLRALWRKIRKKPHDAEEDHAEPS